MSLHASFPRSQMLARRVARDVHLHGETLRAGERALLLVGSANRDERVFERAGEYDILRDTTQSLSFGRGVHFCLGAALARLEGRSEEHTSELQSLMRIPYAVFCLKKKN